MLYFMPKCGFRVSKKNNLTRIQHEYNDNLKCYSQSNASAMSRGLTDVEALSKI